MTSRSASQERASRKLYLFLHTWAGPLVKPIENVNWAHIPLRAALLLTYRAVSQALCSRGAQQNCTICLTLLGMSLPLPRVSRLPAKIKTVLHRNQLFPMLSPNDVVLRSAKVKHFFVNSLWKHNYGKDIKLCLFLYILRETGAPIQ